MREPWLSFLVDLDRALPSPTELHCFGAFVLSEEYGLGRPTADVDIVEAIGIPKVDLARLAGRQSDLHTRHRVYLDIVTVATIPERYAERLTELSPPNFNRLRLRAVERHDLILAKLARNSDRDIEDLRRVALGPGLDPAVLRQRYHDEMRYQSSNPAREDLTLALWLEILAELKTRRP